MIDAYCHLDSPRFDAPVDALLAAARLAGVRGWLVAGVDRAGWIRQEAMASEHAGIKPCFGIHPWTACRMSEPELDEAMVDLAARARNAIGEMGLDRSRTVPRGSLPGQTLVFRAQLELARARNLPVVLHVVGAHGATLDILESDGLPKCGGMVHSFSAAPELAARYEALGLHISFSGSVTRPGARHVASAVKAVSAGRLLVETDCPDQRPFERSGAINRPQWLVDVVKAVAEIRGESPDVIAQQSAANAETLFGSFS